MPRRCFSKLHCAPFIEVEVTTPSPFASPTFYTCLVSSSLVARPSRPSAPAPLPLYRIALQLIFCWLPHRLPRAFVDLVSDIKPSERSFALG